VRIKVAPRKGSEEKAASNEKVQRRREARERARVR